ncbi:hypothetical protein SAY86_013037 [Trapa natans]|uniref:Serpin domain-containing protein n=1 Tax=Trapa natans TaxID=22666 RepID=A0AAN7LT50_TRANT|nr:hypothetical protein SAY86_013037 [Trapa natans]
MDVREAISSQTDIALSFFKQLLSSSEGSNLVFSPLSIHVVLSLIAAGSGGTTLTELLSFLKSQSVDHLNSFASELVAFVLSDGSPDGGPKLSFANGLWLDSSLSLKPPFKYVVDTMYKAAAHLADFKTKAVEVTNEVNSWAKNETAGLIKEVLPANSVEATTRLIFANALYFKGAWNEKFESLETKESEFYLIDGSCIQVPFMTSRKKQTVNSFDGFKVLRLPYKQGNDRRNFSMYFFLPDAKDGLSSLAEKACSEPGFIERHLPQKKVEIGDFKLPRFKISYGFEASEVLKKLGLVGPFSEGGLTEMVDTVEGQNLYVSSVFHKSFIEVNEEGTEAAAASAGVIKLRSLMLPEKIDFVADHPFLFLILEDMTGMMLFTGQVFNPSTI